MSDSSNELKMMYFHKAESRAKWSYIGIIFPIIGLIIGLMAWSTTNNIVPENEQEERAKRKIIDSAGGGIFFSIVSGVLSYIFVVSFINAFTQSLSHSLGA